MSTPTKNAASTADATKAFRFRIFLLIMMVLQNSSAVLVGRYTRSSVPENELYSVNHLIFVVECMKFIMSAALEFRSTSGLLLQSIKTHVLNRPADALKISIPALLYLVQNTLLYVGLSNLSAPLFQVTYQCKLVTTALVSGILLNRKYKFQQWVCLFSLSLGVAIVVLGEKSAAATTTAAVDKGEDAAEEMDVEDSKDDTPPQNLALGLVAVTIACLSSALAGVYFEMVIKKPSTTHKDDNIPPPSLWMRNMQLSFFSLVIAAGQGQYENYKASVTVAAAAAASDAIKGLGVEEDADLINDIADKPYLFGFTFWVWVLVWLQAGGGLLIAAVIKYTDNVLKGLATGVSIVFATGFAIIFMGTRLSYQFFVGAIMILVSVYIFSNPISFGSNKNRKILPK